MTPQLQTTETDCLRACIATLLDHDLDQVPDFTQDQGGELEKEIKIVPQREKYWYRLQSWLSERSLAMIEFSKHECKTIPFPALCIAKGKTALGSPHAIIATCEGSLVVPQFDPAGGDNVTLATIESVCFLVPRNIGYFVSAQKKLLRISLTAQALRDGPLRDSILEACEA